MKHLTRLLPGVLLVGTLVLGGCGKTEEEPTRFNRVIGDTPLGVPTGTGIVDAGILQDQSAYKPADYEPLEGGPAAGGGAGGPEAEAIQTVLSDLIAATFEFDIDTIIDSFVPDQVAVLREDDYMSTFYETKDTLDAYQAVLEDKATGPEFEAAVKLEGLMRELAEPLANAIGVTVLDEENAVATFELKKLDIPQEVLAAAMEAIKHSAGMMSSTGAPEGPGPGQPQDPNATAAAAPGWLPVLEIPADELSVDALLERIPGGETIRNFQMNLQFRKVDDEWKLALPFSFDEEEADLLNEGVLLLQEYYGELTTLVDQAETLDLQTFAQIQMSVGRSKGLALFAWYARARAMAASMIEAQAGETDAAEAAGDEEEEPSEPNAPDPNATRIPRGGRRGP